MTTTIDINEIEPQLAELLSLAKAGNEVIIAEGETPVARLVSIAPPVRQRIAGLHQGSIWISDDFDDYMSIV